jgi:hypothetical protein
METIQQSTNIYIPFENEYVRLYRSSVVCVQPGRARSKRSKQTILVGVEVAGEQGHRSLNSGPTYCGRTPDGLLLYRRTRGYSPPKTLAPHRHPPYWWSPISRLEPQPNYNQFCRETGSKPANWERQRTSRVDGREVGSAWLDREGPGGYSMERRCASMTEVVLRCVGPSILHSPVFPSTLTYRKFQPFSASPGTVEVTRSSPHLCHFG